MNLPEGVDAELYIATLMPDGTLTIDIGIPAYVEHHQQAANKCATSLRNRLERVDNSPWDSCI